MEIVWPVELSVEAAVVWHLLLGLQHASVWNTSVAAMTKLVEAAAGGPAHGPVVCTSPNSAIRIKLDKSAELLV